MTLAHSSLAMHGPSTSTPKRFGIHTSAIMAFVSPPAQTSPIKQLNTIIDQSTPPCTETFVDSATSPFEKSSLHSVNTVILPLAKEEEAYHTHLTCLKMAQSGDKLTLTCKTRGQPLIFKKVQIVLN